MRSVGTILAHAFTICRLAHFDKIPTSTKSLVRTRWILNAATTVFVMGFGLLCPDAAKAVSKTSTGSGNWSVPGTWSPSGAPATGDDVTIGAGHTVTYDVFPVSAAPILASLTVNGTLSVGDLAGNNTSVLVGGNVTITAAGTLTVSVPNASHSLFISGNLTNDGIFDGFPAANREINVFFNGSTNQTVGGTGATTRFNSIRVDNVGMSGNNIVDLSPTNFVASPKFLTLTSGILKISGTYALSDAIFAGAGNYRINSDEGIWLNNPNATITAQSGSIQLDGSIRITKGNYNIGTDSGDSLRYNGIGFFTIEGGACNIAGRFERQSTLDVIVFDMSGGTLTVNTVGNPVDDAPSVDIGAASAFSMSGGTIVIQGENTSASPIDYRNTATNPLITGGTVQFGNALTQAGAVYEVDNSTGAVFPSLVIDATAAPTLRLQSAVQVIGNLTIGAGASLNANNLNITLSGNSSAAGNWINNGSFISGTGTVTLNSSAGQLVGGLSATTFNGLIINNSAGVTLGTNASVNGTLTLTTGNVDAATNSKTLSIGPAGTVTRTSGHVIGNLQKSFVGTGAKDFEVGTANGFSKVTVNMTAGTFPAAFTVSATQGPQPAIPDPTKALQRYWSLATAGAVTATLTFNYIDPADIPVTANESDFQIVKVSPGGSGGTPSFPGGMVSTGTNTAAISGVSSFSDWTLSEPFAPTEVHLVSFNATRYESGVLLEWQTGYEVRNLGFNVYREQAGKRIRITPSPIAGSALQVGSYTSLTAGQSYAWLDPSAAGQSTGSASDENRHDPQYYLEDIDINGKITLHGPFTTTEGGGIPRRDQSDLLSKLKADATLTPLRQVLPPAVKAMASGIVKSAGGEVSRQRDIAAKPAAKLLVKQPGWFRINQPELAAAGIDASRDPRFLQMFVDGVEIPIIVNGEQDGIFDAGDSVEFYGVSLDTPLTDRNVYWLRVGTSHGLRINSASGIGDPDAVASFPFTVERRDRSTFFAALKNGDADNWFGAVIASEPVNQSLKVQQLSPSPNDAFLEVALQGVTDMPGSLEDHNVEIQLNGVDLGAMLFDGRTHQVSRFKVPTGSLVDGDNVITLRSLGGIVDISLVDYVRLTYSHNYIASNDTLSFTADGNRAVTVGGFSSAAVRVVDVTDPAAPVELKASVSQRGSAFAATFSSPGSGKRSLLAFANTQVTPPAAVLKNQPSSWNSQTNGADFVMISYREFVSSLTPLRDLRRSQGYSVSVIDVEDLYDEFSYGHHTPQAIKDFLAHANVVWKKVPRFVLLAGDGSSDPRNYTGFGEWNLVAMKQVETSFMETASDDWFVDFNLDGLPEMAIGRLPVRTLKEVGAVVSKIVAYAKSGSPDGVVLIADRNDSFNFEAATSSVKKQLPPGTRVVELLRGQMDDVTLSAAIIDVMNRGPKIVNYVGHGTFGGWRGNIFSAADAIELTNSDGLSFALMMTCLNGMFQEASGNGLAEALLKAEQGGAVAVWASSAITRPDGQAAINQAVIKQAFSSEKGKRITLGEATMRAKAATTDGDVRRSWILFGDPTTRLK